MNDRKVCSILFYDGHISYSPTIINLARILDKHEFQVNIYTGRSEAGKVGEMGKVKIITFLENRFKKSLNKIRFKNAGKSIIFAVEILLNEIIKKKQNTIFKKNDIIIGVDICGSLVALLYFYIFKVDFFILSLELYPVSRSLKKLMKLACMKSKGVIIQDEDRFKTLCDDYGYQHQKVFYLPNSPTPLENIYPKNDTGNYFREKFNLSVKEFPYIILQAGAIADFVLSKVLATSFASISNGCALIIHSRTPKKLEDPYIKSLLQCNSNNLFLSLEPVDYDEIDKIYSSSTIGLAFYGKNLSDNFSKISKASGKLAEYLKYGKPVLVNDLPGLVELIEKYHCGLVIRDPSNSKEISEAIEKITDSYEWYSNNAKFCYESEFDFNKNMKPILDYMNTLIKTA